MSYTQPLTKARKCTLMLLDGWSGSISLGAGRPSVAPLLLAFLDGCSEHQQRAEGEDKGEAAVASSGTPAGCKKAECGRKEEPSR